MTAGCSINSCKSALYVLLASPYYACFEPIEKQSTQPHLSASKYEVCMEVVSTPLSLHLFIVLRRRRFANNYWSRYGSLLVSVWITIGLGGQTTISFHTKPLLVCPWMTIGLGANDYWFIGQRTIVPPCLPWLPPFPRAEYFSVLYLIARVIGLRDRPLPAAGEGAPHRRRV